MGFPEVSGRAPEVSGRSLKVFWGFPVVFGRAPEVFVGFLTVPKDVRGFLYVFGGFPGVSGGFPEVSSGPQRPLWGF